MLDTNVVSEPLRAKPDPRVVRWLYEQPVERTFVSVLTLAEIDQGIEHLPLADPRQRKYESFRDSLEADFAGRVLPLESDVVRLWGTLAGRYQRTFGGRPPVVDALLTATAQHRRLYVATRNLKDVRNLGWSAFNPWTDDPADFPIVA
ncbi:type II toxin-antitoxin system VapC family toxin [Phenylobacterium sp.]|uniref:type II toxin-antitoxin system VapC family toxin n=1 Tax=Phenylobacterium sp. TaxID=1871053 RepID=UPI0025F70155|nr:type II toxin-antitoxin system VapC family toxin [Phenylobacterium sp.]MBX3483151.1 type II toxin-antitoxin system VapC family toxin [Phenylobacterium sp.]MCW5760745.1 type II toxin-antitoxin system VapC family toxin [Phenylobacterium sp.]